MRIHASNVVGVILWTLLKQQNTGPFSGRPNCARVKVRRDLAGAVNRKVAPRQAHDLFAVMALFAGRNNDPVGDDVVDGGVGERAGKAEHVHLHGRGPVGEHTGSRASGDAVQVDCDIERKLLRRTGDFVVPHVPRVDEAVDGTLQPLAPGVARIGAERERGDLEFVAIVRFQNGRHEHPDRMLPQVRRKIADANPAPVFAPRRGRARDRRELVRLGPCLRAGAQ
jgi:hypothetical protein